jgi:hypothetical protein
MAIQLPLQAPLPAQSWLEAYGKGAQLKNQLQQERIANAISQNTLNYAPQTSEAEIGLKKGQAYENYGRGQNYFEEAKTHPSKSALNYAQASEAPYRNALTAMETKYIPEKYAIERARNERASNRFGEVYQFAKVFGALPAPLKAQYAAANPEAYQAMLQMSGNSALESMGNPMAAQQQQPMNALNQPMPQMQGQQPPNNSGNGVAPPENAALSASIPQFAQANPQQNADFKKAAQMTANQALTTAATRRQMEGAIQVENIINDPMVQGQAMNAAKYAGALRKGKAAAAALSQSNPESYEDYLAFKNQTMVLLQNRIKTLDQMGATDKQREELAGLYSKTMDSLTSNPDQFIKQFNKLGTTLDTVARSVQKSAEPMADVNRLSGFKPIGAESAAVPPELANMSMDDLQRIANGGQ